MSVDMSGQLLFMGGFEKKKENAALPSALFAPAINGLKVMRKITRN